MHVARTSILHARRIRCGRSTAGTGAAPGSVGVGRVGAPGTGCGRFLRRLEEESYAFLIRPRRFGKSLWVSVLENYYDRTRADEWHAVFDGTDVGRQPTEDRSRYVILRFNFSAFDDTLETLRERFEAYCEMVIRRALERNVDLFPDAAVRRILAPPATEGRLGELFTYAGDRGIPLYGLIDEYDNFANTVLAHHGREAYESFTHGGGFYRNFFATLKAGAGESGGGLERLFITGVSPITMDDVTSGFNSGTNVSLSPRFNDLLGFTENEVRNLLELSRERGAFDQGVDATLAVMREWYNGYRFAKGAQGDLYNTDMVLYYLKHSVPNQPPPDDLIDVNVRIDYRKLRHLLVVNREVGVRFNGNFDLLRNIAGEGGADADVNLGFPLEELVEPENFLSLLYYFGLLSIRGESHGPGSVSPTRPCGGCCTATCATATATSRSSRSATTSSRTWWSTWPTAAHGGRRWSSWARPSQRVGDDDIGG